MSDYRRYYVPGGTYFFTLVTAGRAPIFDAPAARAELRRALRECAAKYPWKTLAMVLLPEHLHVLWSLPAGDDRYSLRWSRIKGDFSRAWLARGGSERQQVGGEPSRRARTASREGRRGVWQRRFWEHTIRDERDLESHFDYIHYNPVKHGHVTRPRDWPWSTFHRWVKLGHYQLNWGAQASPRRQPRAAGE